MRSLVTLGFVVAVAHMASAAHADLGIDVRAQANVALELSQDAEGTRIRVRLLDDLGTPIASAQVNVALDATPAECAQALSLTTRRDGTAQSLVPRSCVVRGAFARFDGDTSYEANESTLRAEQARAHVDVRIAAEHPERVDLDAETFLVHVGASPADHARGSRVQLLDELARVLATTVVTESGEATMELATSALGAPGPGTLNARVVDAGGAELGHAEIPIVRFRAVIVSLEPRARREETELAGVVRDAAGPIGGATVSILTGSTNLASAVSDVHGRFAVRIGSDRWPRGASEIEVLARYAADRPGREDTDSRTLTLVAPGAGTRFDVRYGLPLIAGAIAYLLARKRKRAEPEQLAPVVEEAPPVVERVERASIAPWAPRVHGLGVIVLDRKDDGVVSGASVVVRARDVEIASMTTDALGRAHFEALPEGAFEVHVSSPEHATERFSMRSPHRGEWNQVRVRIETFRAKARRALAPVAERVLVPPATFADATLREIGQASASQGADSHALVVAIESASYGARPPTAEEVARFDDAVRTVASAFPERPRSPLR